MDRADISTRHAAGEQPADPGLAADRQPGRRHAPNDPGATMQDGRVDYEERGAGPAIVFVPGSCSTAAAWRAVVAHLEPRFRCVATSLLGYGGTEERRTVADPSISHECAAVEAVVEKAGGRVHLVGHSFGGLVALGVALRGKVRLASLTIIEAPAADILRERNEDAHYTAFRRLTHDYFSDYANGNPQAIAAVIDFYGGAGTFASWPARVRAYAVETTRVNMLDWASAYGFALSADALSAVKLATRICVGALTHPAVLRANELLAECVDGASLSTIEEGGHFMIATHAREVSQVIAAHVGEAETQRRGV